MAGNDNIKVIIKVRPLIKRERDAKQMSQWRVNGDCIECINPMNPAYRFVFDEICDENSSTHDLYVKVAKPIVQSTINGFNGTIFAYGQTSSGKTHTMMGSQGQPGITPLAIREIFAGIDRRQERSFLLKVTYIEIYNEKVYDLLNSRNEVKIQEQASGELYIERKEMIVTSEKCIMDLLNEGNNLRKVAETNMNVQSSRSHTIFSIMIESDEVNATENEEESATVVSMLNLVDLAGSERADATGATGNRLKEGSHINKSLLSLSLVINKLSDGQEQHINYRDSKLTRILQLSLGGNAMTAIICTVTPAAVDETNYTLGFASRAKRVKNKPVINHVVSDALTLKKMKKQISSLEEQLENERKQHLEYIEKEKRLNRLKDGILQYRPKSGILVGANRRKTWAADMKASSLDQLVDLQPMRPEFAVTSLENKSFKFSEFGHNIEYSDERFQSFLNASFTVQMPEVSIARPPKARTSLLKTPKSIRNILNRDRSETPSSALASPVTTVDKDKHIRRLQAELEELQYFQQTESTLRSADLQNIAKLKEQLEEKAKEIDRLNADMDKLNEDISTLKATNQQCIENAKAANATVLRAEMAKREAEQIVCSVQFELEQHVARANRRENELVEQLDSLRSDNVVAAMKEKMNRQSDALTKLESEYWQNEKAHKEDIKRLMNEKAATDEKSNKLIGEILKLQTIQDDYDEVSAQLVDSVQDNDALKKKFDEQTIVVSELEKTVSALKAQLKDSIAIGVAKSDESSADVEKFQQKFDELEGIVSKLEKQCERYSTENQMLSENLKAESQALAVESKLKNQLQAEFNDLMADLAAFDKHRDELEAKLNEQKQSYEKELETLKANESEMRHTLQAEIDELQAKLLATENLNQSLNVQLQAKFNEEWQSHQKELETVNEIHEKRQNALKESLDEMDVVCKDIQFELDEQKAYNATLASERDESIKYCQEVMHENSMLSNACEHCRITVQFLNKELEVLRRTYTELQMSVAEQELGSLKLQKTICEISETSNISYLLETTETEGQNQSVQSSSRRSTLHKVRQSLGILNEVVSSSPSAKPDAYKEKFESIVDRLTAVMPVDGMDMSPIDYNRILDKFISIYQEFNAIVKYMDIESADIDAQTIIVLIQSLKNQTNDTENAKQLLETEIAAITDKFSQLENELKEAEERLRASEEIDKNHLDEINYLKREINELKAKRVESEVAYQALSEKCLQFDRERKEFETKIESITQNSQLQRNEFNELQRKFNENTDRSNQLDSDELKSLRGKLSDTESELSALRIKIESRDEEIALLKNVHQEFIAIAKYMGIESAVVDFQMIIASIQLMKNQTKATENAKQLLETEIGAISNKCSQLESKLKVAEERLESLDEIDKNRIDEINNLKRQISELNAKRVESEVAYEAVSEKCLRLDNEKKEFEAQIECLTQNGQIQLAQLNDLQKQFNEMKEHLNLLLEKKRESDELGSLQEKLIETVSQLSTMKLNVEKRNEEISILKMKLEEFNEIVKYMDVESADVDAQMVIAFIQSLKNQNKGTESAKLLLETEITATAHKCSQLENQLKEAEQHSRSLGEIDKNRHDEINNLKREIGDLKAKQVESEVAYQALSEKCQQFDHEKKDFEAQIKSLTQNNQIQLDQFNELEQQLSETKNAKQSLESEIRHITSECSQRNSQLMEVQEHLKSQGEIDKNRLDEINNLKREIGELTAKRVESEAAYKALSEECLQFDREKKEFEAKIESITQNSHIQRDQFNTLQQQFNENTKRLNQLLEKDSVELKSLQQQLIETESELSAMRVSINSRNEEIATLKRELQEKPKNRLVDTQTTMSPKPGRASMSPLRTGKTALELDHLRNENHKLKSMQKSLENELQELRRSSNQVRKIKRHSTHDDTRRISGFDSCMLDIGTQTDPASENCRCTEFCKQIDKLKEEIIIKEARYFTLKRDTGVDALNEEVARLKSTLTTTKTDLNTTKAHLDRLTDKYSTLKLRSTMTLIKAPRVDVSVQTDDSAYSSCGRTFSGEMDLQRAHERCEKYKRAYAAKQNEFCDVKAAFEKFKCEVASEKERLAGDAEQLKRKFDDVSAKYSDVKVICNHRLAELQTLGERLKKTDAELTLMKKKYDKAKTILMSRTTELEELKQKNQRLQTATGNKNNENVPNNF